MFPVFAPFLWTFHCQQVLFLNWLRLVHHWSSAAEQGRHFRTSYSALDSSPILLRYKEAIKAIRGGPDALNAYLGDPLIDQSHRRRRVGDVRTLLDFVYASGPDDARKLH